MSGGSYPSSNSDRISKKYTTYEDWCLINAQLCGYLENLTLRVRVSSSQFKAKREGTHSRCGDALISHIKNLESQMNDLQDQIISLSQLPFPPTPFLQYDDQKNNLVVRKYIFSYRKERVQQIEILSQKFGFLTDMRSNALLMYNLFSGNIIPSGKILRLKDNFFKITFPDSIAHEEQMLKYLQAYTKRLAAQIAQFPEPLWKNSFHTFLIDLIKQGTPRLDQELMYFRELEDEIAFSRALFNPQSIYQNKIDELFKSDLKTENTTEFVSEIMDFCDEFIPEDELNSDEQTCCILILVRAIFNRFYERCEKLFAPKFDSDYQKIEDLKQVPALLFTIPTELVQLPITGSISSYFRSDPFFLAAAQFLSQTIFQSNPIDSLYYIHKCLIGIQKGALIRRLGGVDAKMEDVRSLLCFDDLFSLFFGILMASDIPDIYFVADFISRYAPKNSLSPAFEYATANTEALIEHVRRLDLNELKEKAKS